MSCLPTTRVRVRIHFWSLGSQLEVMPGKTFVVSFFAGDELLSQWRGYCPRGGYRLVFSGLAIREQTKWQRFAFVQ